MNRDATLTRAAFLRNAAMTALGLTGGCRLFTGDTLKVNGVKVGVQMWSVERLWKSRPDVAFRRLRAMGYTGVQSMAFYKMDWDELERQLDGEGVRIVDMPFELRMFDKGGMSRFVEFCDRFDIDFVYEPMKVLATGAEWKRHIQKLRDIAVQLEDEGLRVGYHNHQFDFTTRFDGTNAFEMLYQAGFPFEFDVGHAKLAGEDPVAWLGKLTDRVPSIHAKPAGGTSVGGRGDANDWPAIFSAAEVAGTKWAIVECEVHRDTYCDVEDSMSFLKWITNLETEG